MTLLALWATPRTVSTAFERMMIERGDFLVLDEPWSRAYYLGPEQRSTRFPISFPESTYAAVESGVLALAREQHVFVKDMAYHVAPAISDDALASMRHTFLVRDPLAALTSLHKQWPDFTVDEAGYRAQRALFERVTALQGEPPPVIDSDVLRADPSGIIDTWCSRIGIDHLPHALRWSPGMRDEWPLWRDWYENAARSTGFAPPTPPPVGAIHPAVEQAAGDAERHMTVLRAHVLR
ncbi:MAG: sulfotransferase family protein [Actinomycetota bacterium]